MHNFGKAKIRVDLPKPVRDLFKRHVGLCKKHNHIFPRGECPGRCPDCGGCNQGDKCTHYNVSGGPKHPSQMERGMASLYNGRW